MYSQKLDTIAQQRKDVTKLTEEFNEGLQSFEENFHDECETKGCEHYQKKIRDLYKDYYTCLVPGRWDESRSEYREQLARDIESSMPLEEVHARVLEEKRQARINQKDIISEWRERELSNHPGDHLETIRFKDQATAMLNNGNALEEVMKFMNEEAHKVLSIIPGNRHILLDQINTAMTPEQKRQAKKEWHTFPAENDSPQTRDFKHNLSRMFDSDMPLDEIDSSIIQYKKQQDYRSGIHEELIRAKRSKIEENIYAWRAHVRSKKEKNERAVARAAERKASQKDYNTHLCSGFDDLGIPCRNHAAPVDEDRGPLECAICDRAIENGRHIRRSFFCSSSCAERSWATHKHRTHPCSSSNCLNSPSRYRANCPECDQIFNVKSSFCSPECMDSNKESHVRDVHIPLLEKLKDKMNQELESEFLRFQSVTAEEMQREIDALEGEGSEIEMEEFEELKKGFSALRNLGKDAEGFRVGRDVEMDQRG